MNAIDWASLLTFMKSIYHSPPAMFTLAMAAANTKTLIYGALLGAYKVPFFRSALFGDPPTTKAKLATLVAEVDEDIDEIAAAHASAIAPSNE